MTREVTILDVAKEARVSKSTVSRVLSGDNYGVSLEAKARVERAVEKLNYVRNSLAYSMRTNQTRMILLIIPDITNSFWAEVARGVQDVFDREGYSVVLANSDWEEKRERRYIQIARMNRVDAVMINAPDIDVSELDGIHCPVVLLGEREKRGAYPVVGTDTFQAVKDALEFLYKQGHRDFGLVHHERLDSEGYGSSRLKAFQCFLKEKGIPILEDRFFQAPLTMESGKDIAHRIRNLKNPPTALIAGNDLVAIGFIQEAKKLGIEIPEHISLIGIDDIPSATRITPALTTIGKPTLEIGKKAAELILTLLQGDSVDPINLLPGKLIIRETTMCRKGGFNE